MNQFCLFSIFQSGMVLQRKKPITIWGNAPAGALIRITLSHRSHSRNAAAYEDAVLSAEVQVQAAHNGTWECTLPSQSPGEGYMLSASCSDAESAPIFLDNISVGDVWLACGQSNMEFFLRYDEEWKTIQNYPKNPQIHLYNVPQLAFFGQQKDTRGQGCWISEGDDGFETFSAPGYSFARHLQPSLNIPIGIIGCNWGGTTASAWLDESYLAKEPLNIYQQEYETASKQYSEQEMKEISLKAWEFEISEKHTKDFMPLMYGQDFFLQQQYLKDHADDPVIPMGPFSINRPGGLYHQMLEPLNRFSIKGVLWYQGESDACHADIYDKLMSALITCWRKARNEEFPFLFVQLAPFGRWLQCDSTGYCQVRAMQELVSKSVPNTAMVSIMDIGSYYDIHPKKKMEVGRRLALLARGKVYGENILCDSPEFTDCTIRKLSGNSCALCLTFSNCSLLSLTPLSQKALDIPLAQDLSSAAFSYSQLISCEEIKGFRIEQNHQTLPIKNIRLQNNQVILEADILPDIPCTISLAWADYAVVNLVNEARLPIKPFCITISHHVS